MLRNFKTFFASALALLLLASPPGLAFAAPVQAPVVYDSSGRPIGATPVVCVDATGTYAACGSTGGGSGGAVYGPDAVGAAPTQPPLFNAGQYQATTLPTCVTGAVCPMQTDTNGSLRARMLGIATAGADGTANNTLIYPSAFNTTSNPGPMGAATFSFNGTTWDRSRGNTNGDFAQGNVAAAATDAGNPVKIGGVFNTTPPTYTTGQRGDAQLDAKGSLKVILSDTAGSFLGMQNFTTDAASTTNLGLFNNAVGRLFDGTNLTRARDIVGAAGAGTGTQSVAIAPTFATNAAIIPSVSASAAATSLIAKASAGNLYRFDCKSSAAGNCLAMNRTTVPTAGALTSAEVLKCVPVAAGAMAGFIYGDIPERFSAGIVLVFSSSTDCDTYTASSTAKITASMQ